MTSMEFRTRVGPDGILTLTIPVGLSEVNREVKVVVESAEDRPKASSKEEWAQFIAATAGAWQGELARPEQGAFEVRDQWP